MNNRVIRFIIILLLTVSIVAPAVIMLLFNMAMNGSYFSFGLLSKDSSAWSNFGSLLSGAFTMLGSVASLATIAYVYKQNKDALENAKKQQRRTEIQAKMQQKKTEKQALQQIEQARQQLAEAKAFNATQQDFIEKQLERMRFDSYRAHKEYFNIILDDLEADLQGLKFTKRNDLYQKIFPMNSPFNFSIKSDSSDNEGYKFHYEIVNTLDRIFSLITHKAYREPGNSIMYYFMYLWHKLNFRPRNYDLAGDVFNEHGLYCINIYHLEEDLQVITKVVNSLLLNSGNEEKKEYNPSAASGVLKGALLKYINRPLNYRLHEKNNRFDSLLIISFKMDCLTELTKPMLVRTRRLLMNCTDRSENLLKLRNKDKYIDFVKEINHIFFLELDSALSESPMTEPPSAEDMRALQEIEKDINSLQLL